MFPSIKFHHLAFKPHFHIFHDYGNKLNFLQQMNFNIKKQPLRLFIEWLSDISFYILRFVLHQLISLQFLIDSCHSWHQTTF